MKNKTAAIATLGMALISFFSLGVVFLMSITKAIVEAKKNEEEFFSTIQKQNEDIQEKVEYLQSSMKELEKRKKDKEKRRKKQEEMFELNGEE